VPDRDAGGAGSSSPTVLFCALPMAERRLDPKSKYTLDRGIPGAFEGETVTRRRMMTLTANAAGGIAVAAFVLPALGFAAGSALFDRPPVEWEPVGAPGDFPDDTYLPRVITETPGIGQVGKTTAYVRARNPEIDRAPNPPGYEEQFIAVSTRCMHLGCPVRYIEAAQRFVCPCHGGVYDFEGKVDGGPPVRPLDRFYTRVRNGQVEIGPRYSVNGEFRRFPSYRDPAQDLDGIGQYLYPGRFSTPKMD
jgi:menaquinol-cytochrome c reductase iron-sulfur subunit